MTVTTDESWAIDGVDLSTLAYNIETWGDDKQGVPDLKGGDIDVTDSPGEEWRPKLAGPRVITFAGWVRGTDADGVGSADSHATMTANWRMLRRLFWQPHRQFLITKRWRLENGDIETAYGWGQFDGGMVPINLDKSTDAAKFTVDVRMAFPYFMQDEISTANLAAGTHVIDVPGDDVTRLVRLELNESGSGMYVQNNETGRRVTVPIDVILDCKDFSTNGMPELLVAITGGWTWDKYWFQLLPGENEIVVSGGIARLHYVPLYV